jgi:hypothetical protein
MKYKILKIKIFKNVLKFKLELPDQKFKSKESFGEE